MENNTNAGDPDPWDELEDQRQSEARILVDAIKEAKARRLTSVKIVGVISSESTRKLQSKGYAVSAGMTETGVQTLIEFSGPVVDSRPAKESQPPVSSASEVVKVVLRNPPQVIAGSAKDSSNQLSPAFLLMQQREEEERRFAAQQAQYGRNRAAK